MDVNLTRDEAGTLLRVQAAEELSFEEQHVAKKLLQARPTAYGIVPWWSCKLSLECNKLVLIGKVVHRLLLEDPPHSRIVQELEGTVQYVKRLVELQDDLTVIGVESKASADRRENGLLVTIAGIREMTGNTVKALSDHIEQPWLHDPQGPQGNPMYESEFGDVPPEGGSLSEHGMFAGQVSVTKPKDRKSLIAQLLPWRR